MAARRAWSGLFAAALLAVNSCVPGDLSQGEGRPAPAPRAAPEVLYAGCETRAEGCALAPEGPLRIHVALGPEEAIEVAREGAPLQVEWTSTTTGRRAELPPVPGLVTLRGAGWSWSLAVRAPAPEPAALAEIRALLGEEGAAAQARIEALVAGLAGAARAEGLKLRADREFLRAAYPAALAGYEEAYTAALAAGSLGRASDVALTAVFVCVAIERDLGAARRWLARHEELLARAPEARLRHGHYAGMVADRAGDWGAAIRDHREQARVARALGLAVELAAALSALGVLQGRLGDAAAAEEAFVEALALGPAIPADVRATVLHNAAWVALEARARGEAAADPEPRLAEAAAIFAADPRARFEADEARLNLAYAAALRGDAAAARGALAQVGSARGGQGRWRRYVTALADRLEGAADAALAGFRALGEEALREEDRGLAWAAAIGAGEALLDQGAREAALVEFRRAAALHRADVGALALDLGRARFAASRDRGAQLLVALLLALGRGEEALCAARRARAQALAEVAAASRDPAALAAYREARARLDAEVERTWDMSLGAGESERARLRAQRRALDAALDAALRGGTSRGAGAEGQVSGTGAGADGKGAGTGEERQGDGEGRERRGAAGAGAGAGAEGQGGGAGEGRKVLGTGVKGQGPGGRDGAGAGAEAGETGWKGQVADSIAERCEDLRAPDPGELLLVYFPLARGHAAFAATDARVVARELSAELPDDPAARASLLLGPFAAELEGAARVTIAASGPLAREAFHALPWGEGPLVASRAVVYALDLPRAPAAPRAPARALQIVPASNLARAAEEERRVAAILRERGARVERLAGVEPDLRARLGVDLLHFIGHARGGGWGAALDLGGDRELAVADLLAGPAPRVALLSGCETGLLDPRAHAGGLSLAHALLVAGSEGVLAAEREVADDLAVELVPAVTSGLVAGEGLGEALRAAQARVRPTRADWALFRAFVP